MSDLIEITIVQDGIGEARLVYALPSAGTITLPTVVAALLQAQNPPEISIRVVRAKK